MKILFLVQKEQRVILDRFYSSICRHAEEADLRRLTSEEQADLKGYFHDHVDTSKYDRIVFFLRFKKEMKQWRFMRTIPNLVMLEHDAYQNFIPGKYCGAYTRHYHRMPWLRVICSGAFVCERLKQQEIDAAFVPKGYDQFLLKNLNRERAVDLGFVGSIKSGVYHQRKEFLARLADVEPLQVVRTQSGQEYLEKLNDIRFFVGADIGMGEYMIKNFEAMACGCVLLAWRQGNGEEAALGFEDMKNAVLYSDLAELREKLALLRGNVALAQNIADAGQQHTQTFFSFDVLGRAVVDALQPALPKPEDYSLPWFKQLFG